MLNRALSIVLAATLAVAVNLLFGAESFATDLYVDNDDPNCGGRTPCYSAVRDAVEAAIDPDGAWMRQIARNWTDSEDGFLLRRRYLIHDRDPLFTKAFRETLERSGVRPVKLPSRSPNLNAYAERFDRSIRSECLAQVIPIGEAHVRRMVREYVEHYHSERNHQGIGNRLIDPPADELRRGGAIECRERLGGLLRYYCRAA